MALISCPECGKEISNKSKNCVHCGYKLARMISIKQKVFIIILSILLLITCTFTIKKVFFSSSESSDSLEQLLKCENPEDIKNMFGENYETINHNETSSKTESYKNFKINKLDCSVLTLLYDNNTFTGYDCELTNIDTQHLNIIKQKMIGIFGNNYKYNSIDNEEIYSWKWTTGKAISLDIFKDSDTESYHLHIINV